MQHSGMANDFVCCTFSVCELAHVLHLCNVQTPPGPFCPDLQTWERPLQLFLTLVAFHTVERLVPFALVCTMQLHFALSYGLRCFNLWGRNDSMHRKDSQPLLWCEVFHTLFYNFSELQKLKKGKDRRLCWKLSSGWSQNSFFLRSWGFWST